MLVRRNKFVSHRNLGEPISLMLASKRYMTHKARRDGVPHVGRIIRTLFKLQRFSHISYPASTPAFEAHFRFDSSCSAFELLLPVYQWIVTEMMPKGFIIQFASVSTSTLAWQFNLLHWKPTLLHQLGVSLSVCSFFFSSLGQFKMYSFFSIHTSNANRKSKIKFPSWKVVWLGMYTKLLLTSCWLTRARMFDNEIKFTIHNSNEIRIRMPARCNAIASDFRMKKQLRGKREMWANVNKKNIGKGKSISQRTLMLQLPMIAIDNGNSSSGKVMKNRKLSFGLSAHFVLY